VGRRRRQRQLVDRPKLGRRRRPAGDGTDVLQFPTGAARLTNNNDLSAGVTIAQIQFTGGGYAVSGNSIVLGAAGLTDTSTGGVANAIALPMQIGGATTISDTAGNSSAALTVSGVVSGAGSVTKQGAGSVIFTAANTYSGGTTLTGGGQTFANNASGSAFGSGAVTNTDNTLRGNGGFSGALAHNKGLAPGATNPPGGSAGTLTLGNGITFGADSSYGVNLFGTTPGTGYDQLIVTGTVDLGTAHPLNTSGTYTPTGGEKFFIIVNDGVDAVGGAFQSLAEGQTVEVNGEDYTISYQGIRRRTPSPVATTSCSTCPASTGRQSTACPARRRPTRTRRSCSPRQTPTPSPSATPMPARPTSAWR
jgi:autotransporter-associated beta strand protein